MFIAHIFLVFRRFWSLLGSGKESLSTVVLTTVSSTATLSLLGLSARWAFSFNIYIFLILICSNASSGTSTTAFPWRPVWLSLLPLSISLQTHSVLTPQPPFPTPLKRWMWAPWLRLHCLSVVKVTYLEIYMKFKSHASVDNFEYKFNLCSSRIRDIREMIHSNSSRYPGHI